MSWLAARTQIRCLLHFWRRGLTLNNCLTRSLLAGRNVESGANADRIWPCAALFGQDANPRVFFSSWPVLAVLHRMQEAQIRDADCHDAEPGAYALQTRAVPDSFWVCVRRKQDLVDERWRTLGMLGGPAASATLAPPLQG